MISGKVSNGSLSGIVVLTITWILTTYIPAFHSGIPPALAQLIPGLVGAAGYFGGGYLARHKATPDEIEAAIQDAIAVAKIVAPLPAAVAAAQQEQK